MAEVAVVAEKNDTAMKSLPSKDQESLKKKELSRDEGAVGHHLIHVVSAAFKAVSAFKDAATYDTIV